LLLGIMDCRRQPEPKYQKDENVLAGVTAEYRQITTREAEAYCGVFVTDLGLVVPCVSLALRERLRLSIVNHRLGRLVVVVCVVIIMLTR
jgi:hypothetical protein